MKPLCLSREWTLKGLLLLALVANLTWEPLANQFSEMNLASTQAGRSFDCTGKDQHLAQCKPASRDERAAIVAESDLRRAEAAKANKGKTTAAPDLSARTEAATTESCEDCLETDKALAAKKAELAKLTEEVEKLSRRETTTDDDDDAQENAAAAARLREQRANCEIDSDGDKLSDVQELKCLTAKLNSLKGKETASRRKEITRKIESIATRLRKEAKSDVLSKDVDRRNKGEATITDLLTALNSVRFDRDEKREEMIESLEALRAGAEARLAAADIEEEVKDHESEVKSTYRELNQLTRDFQNSCRTRNGCDPSLYQDLRDKQASLGELKEAHEELLTTINETQDEALETLEDHDLTRTELRDYASPFAKLKSRMRTIADPRKRTEAMSGAEAVPGQDSRVDGSGQVMAGEFPADFHEVRNGAGLRRGNGQFQAPGATQIPGQYPQNMQVPMGSPQAINQQMMQQPYSPQYMQPGMIPGQGQSLLPAPPGGQIMGGMNPMMMNRPMMPGQPQMMGGPQVVPVGGQQFGQYGQPYMGGQQVLPPPRY